MSFASDKLREFHEAFGVDRKGGLKALCKRRLTLHQEEAAEVEDALDDLARSIPANRQERLEAVAGELADDLVIAYGTADLLGIDLDKALALKMASNMAKLPPCGGCDGTGAIVYHIGFGGTERCSSCNGSGRGAPIKREDGKVLRPDGWVKPSMSEAIL